MTQDDLALDFFAHYFFENPSAQEVVDEDFDLEAELRDAENLPDDFEDVTHGG